MNINIVPRKVVFDFNVLSDNKYFFDNNSIISTLLISLSTVFPEGERQFVYSVRAFQDKVVNSKQKKEVRAFIGQEAHHGNSHAQLNELIEEKWGYPISKFVDHQIKINDVMNVRLSDKEQLACTTAMEHFTALLADQILKDKSLLNNLHPELQDLFTWHAIEELEHKAVAFDLLKQVDGNQARRKITMVIVTILFFVHMISLQAIMLRRDHHMPNLKEIWQASKFLFGKKGVIRKAIPGYISYFKDDFHPWAYNNSHLIRQWERYYPGIERRLA